MSLNDLSNNKPEYTIIINIRKNICDIFITLLFFVWQHIQVIKNTVANSKKNIAQGVFSVVTATIVPWGKTIISKTNTTSN